MCVQLRGAVHAGKALHWVDAAAEPELEWEGALATMLVDRAEVDATAHSAAWSMPNTTRFVVTCASAPTVRDVEVLRCGTPGTGGSVLGDTEACVAFWRLLSTV